MSDIAFQQTIRIFCCSLCFFFFSWLPLDFPDLRLPLSLPLSVAKNTLVYYFRKLTRQRGGWEGEDALPVLMITSSIMQ